MMNDLERALTDQILQGTITKEEFIRRFPRDLANSGSSIVTQLLNEAMTAENTAEVDDALTIGCWLSLISKDHAPILSRLLTQTWHQSHENIALNLQKLRDPRSIDALYTAATIHLTYLDYDNGLALARKCTYALGDIGTPEAIVKLQQISRSGDPERRKYAIHQLERFT